MQQKRDRPRVMSGGRSPRPPQMRALFDRVREISRVRARLEYDGYPRLQMFLLVAITSASGFVASHALLRFGLTQMWVRYLSAFAVAYLVFLVLLWLWLRTRAEDYVDVPDLLPVGRGSTGCPFEGDGGQVGGSGAGGTFQLPEDAASAKSDALEAFGDGLGSAADAEEFAIPLLALGMLAALILSSFWIVYAAPVLFAELLVDGVLAASLYRRLRGLDPRHWLETAVRRTFLPFAVAAVLAALVGWGMQLYAPEATSIGEVFLYARGAE